MGKTIVYVGTDRGVIRYDVAAGSAITYDHDRGLAGSEVTDLVVRAGIVWVGTSEGLSRLDPKTGLITNFTKSDFGASSNHVFALGVAANGELWVSIGDGVYRYTGA